MISNIITIGDKITLTKVNKIDEINNEMKQYVSSVLDIKDGECIHFGMPSDMGQMVALQIGDTYEICVYTKRGLYQCTGEIVDRYRDGALHVAVFKILSGLVRKQRRQFYRLEKIIDIMHCPYIVDDTDEPMDYQWTKAIMTDISGGGARFISSIRFSKKDYVLLKLVLPLEGGGHEFILKACVISSQMLIHQVGQFESRVEFSEIELSQREAIIRYVFEEERKQRRREKGLV